MGSEPPFAAVVTNRGLGPYLTAMADGSGPITAPRTFRNEGRIAESRCKVNEGAPSGKTYRWTVRKMAYIITASVYILKVLKDESGRNSNY